ncbi:hypothetical protein HELRODRAFT_174694 [Helobdella robusta]|uniref:Uncharacterized protein n=1 Tax=Helobdella robusta TaxID=6412 RepID=T1F8D6_HELRO|nr:hypothetical protein HELRODRAFT_174694 [Helobdella robusta]ESO01719.1 hypothetical protein HELRODRAFT_174694 [Helobdella robusta]
MDNHTVKVIILINVIIISYCVSAMIYPQPYPFYVTFDLSLITFIIAFLPHTYLYLVAFITLMIVLTTLATALFFSSVVFIRNKIFFEADELPKFSLIFEKQFDVVCSLIMYLMGACQENSTWDNCTIV